MGDKGRAMWEVQIKYKNQEGDVRGSGGMQREGSRMWGFRWDGQTGGGCATMDRRISNLSHSFPSGGFRFWSLGYCGYWRWSIRIIIT